MQNQSIETGTSLGFDYPPMFMDDSCARWPWSCSERLAEEDACVPYASSPPFPRSKAYETEQKNGPLIRKLRYVDELDRLTKTSSRQALHKTKID